MQLNFRRRPIVCTTLYRNLMQASNFGGTFDQLFLWNFYALWTEDAFLLLLYHGANKSKLTKNSNQGGGGPAFRILIKAIQCGLSTTGRLVSWGYVDRTRVMSWRTGRRRRENNIETFFFWQAKWRSMITVCVALKSEGLSGHARNAKIRLESLSRCDKLLTACLTHS